MIAGMYTIALDRDIQIPISIMSVISKATLLKREVQLKEKGVIQILKYSGSFRAVPSFSYLP